MDNDLILIKADNRDERKRYNIGLYDDACLRRIISNVEANKDKPSKSEIERTTEPFKNEFEKLLFEGMAEACVRSIFKYKGVKDEK